MSFILDALKKSETERQRQHAPGIANIPHGGRPQSAARWPWVVAGLLVINLVVLGVIMLKREEVASLPPSAAEGPQPAQPGLPASARTPAVGTSQPAPGPARVPAARPGTQAAAAPAQLPAAVEESKPQPAATQQTITDGLPSLRELQAAGQIQLPEMHLDIHVYSGQPADRFVFVNMTKYKEGSTLREGPKVTEITADGVVLDYFGTRFLLPRE